MKNKDNFTNTGTRVINVRDNKVGVVLREFKTGQIAVLENIEPYVINTHESWKTLKIMD